MTFRMTTQDRSSFVARTYRAALMSLFLVLGLTVAGSARAQATWLTGTMCAFNTGGTPQVFALRRSPSGGIGLETAFSTNGGATWQKQIIRGDGNLMPYSVACASDGSSQGVVVVRDDQDDLHGYDRLSGWQESNTGSFHDARGKSRTLIKVTDQGKTKFVLFSHAGSDKWINMYVYDDTTNPKWTKMGFLPDVPGGLSNNAQADMAAYSVNVGPGGIDAWVALWVVDNTGRLAVNEGKLSGPRTWSFIPPPSGKSFSQSVGFGPAVMATFGSPFGHPGSYFETEYVRRVMVPFSDRSGIFSCVSPTGVSGFFCSTVAGQKLSLEGGPARGCFSGAPCAASATFLGTDLGSRLQRYYAGTTDGTTNPPAGWSPVLAFPSGNSALAFTPLAGSNYGAAFFFQSNTNIGFINLDQPGGSNVGAP